MYMGFKNILLKKPKEEWVEELIKTCGKKKKKIKDDLISFNFYYKIIS